MVEKAIAAFRIDWKVERVTCPWGITSSSWTPVVDGRGMPGIKVKFSQRDCQLCLNRIDCAGPKAKRRLMSLRPQARHEALARARERQATAAFGQLYARRAGIEATLSLAVRGYGLRRARRAGLAKVRLQHVATAAALNLTRIVAGDILYTQEGASRDRSLTKCLQPRGARTRP